MKTRGISGQVVVSGATGVAERVGAIPTIDGDVADMEVEPQWLAVAAERTKKAVLTRLDLPDHWVGKIHLQIRPRRELGEASIRIVPVSFPNGWQYRVDVPDPVEWRRLVRVLVEVVLLELANREAGERLGFPPLWINEGMTELVLADRGEDLVLRSDSAGVPYTTLEVRATRKGGDRGGGRARVGGWAGGVRSGNPSAGSGWR